MSNEYIFKEYPRTCAADDFWGQVKRTRTGGPFGVALVPDRRGRRRRREVVDRLAIVIALLRHTPRWSMANGSSPCSSPRPP